MGHYNNTQFAKEFLIKNGFSISENTYGEIIYLNKLGDKITMRIYKDKSCRLY